MLVLVLLIAQDLVLYVEHTLIALIATLFQMVNVDGVVQTIYVLQIMPPSHLLLPAVPIFLLVLPFAMTHSVDIQLDV